MIHSGQHLVVDLVNLDKQRCLNGAIWMEAFVRLSEELGIEIISSYCHDFKPPKTPGITAYVLLDSSHFSVHTYADTGQAAVDLFVCINKDLSRAFAEVQEIVGITESNVSSMKKIRRFKNGRIRET